MQAESPGDCLIAESSGVHVFGTTCKYAIVTVLLGSCFAQMVTYSFTYFFFQTRTLIHIFDKCTQNWFAVASILEHTLATLKGLKPHLSEAFLRSDNAGCYHTAFLLLSLPSLGERTGIRIARYDFSEPWPGKDICDRRIASIKSHIRRFVNEGNDVQMEAHMKVAIESHGGVKGYYASVCKVQAMSQTMHKHSMTGVQSLNNFSYEGGGLRAWRAYNIGPGKFYSSAMLARFGTPQGATNIETVLPFGRPSVEVGMFMTVRPLPPSSVQPSPSQPEPTTQRDEILEDVDEIHFACPEEGCIKVYQSFSALQRHLDLGKHLIKLERQYDQVKCKWAETCLSLTGGYVQAVPSISGASTANQPDNLNMPSAEKGWALKKMRSTVTFSDNARNYLRQVFLQGEETGHKADPVDVASRMKVLHDDSGKKKFQKEEWLTTAKISRYFSRLSTLNKSGRLLRDTVPGPPQRDDDDEDDISTEEAAVIRTRQQIRRELEL